MTKIAKLNSICRFCDCTPINWLFLASNPLTAVVQCVCASAHDILLKGCANTQIHVYNVVDTDTASNSAVFRQMRSVVMPPG